MNIFPASLVEKKTPDEPKEQKFKNSHVREKYLMDYTKVGSHKVKLEMSEISALSRKGSSVKSLRLSIGENLGSLQLSIYNY